MSIENLVSDIFQQHIILLESFRLFMSLLLNFIILCIGGVYPFEIFLRKLEIHTIFSSSFSRESLQYL